MATKDSTSIKDVENMSVIGQKSSFVTPSGGIPVGPNQNMSPDVNSGVIPKVSAPKKIAPITPESTGIPGVGIPQVPGVNTIVPQSLIDSSQPSPEDKTPEAFKRMVVAKAPDGVAKDGRRYADIPAYEFTKMLVDKAPDGVTSAGIPYKDYLVKPRNREEAAVASGIMEQVRKDEAIRDSAIAGVKEDAYKTLTGGVNLVGNVLKTGEKAVGGDSFSQPGAVQPESTLTSAGQFTSGATGLLTDIVPSTLAAKTAFGAMENAPILHYIPDAIGGGMKLASEGLQLTGLKEEDANNIISTLGNLAFLKGGVKGQARINQAYEAGGLGNAIYEAGLQVPQTVIDTALAPLNLSKSVYSKIKGFIRKTPEGTPGTDAGFKYTTDNAKTSEGVPFTMEETPGMWAKGKDLIFQRGTNEDLATRAVFPKATKEKGPAAKTEAGKTALAGVEQLYNDNRTGVTTADISTMQGGSEAIDQGLEHYGKKIGELTAGEEMVNVSDVVKSLQDAMKDPKTRYSGPLKSLAEDITSIFADKAYKNGISINDLQDHLSTIKSKIFGDYKNVSALYKESSGRAVKEFLDEVSNRFDNAIEETTGNLPELQKAKQAYNKYKKIQKDFVASMLVNERNSKGGALSKAGSALGLYELFKNPTLSGIATSIITKSILNEMGVAKSRGGAYESLIRNLDREALARGKSNPSSNDSSNPSSDNSGLADERPVGEVKPTERKPSIIISDSPAEILAFEVSNGKVDIQEAIKQLQELPPEELAKSPELLKLYKMSKDVESFSRETKQIGEIDPEGLAIITKDIKAGKYTPDEIDYIMDNVPKEALPEIINANRELRGLKPIVEETKEITKAPKKEGDVVLSSFKETYPDYGDDLYKIAKKAIEENIEDFESFNPPIKITATSKKGIQNQVMRQRQKGFTKEQEILNDATPEGMTTDEFLEEIKNRYQEKEGVSSVDDAVADAERRMEEKNVNIDDIPF